MGLTRVCPCEKCPFWRFGARWELAAGLVVGHEDALAELCVIVGGGAQFVVKPGDALLDGSALVNGFGDVGHFVLNGGYALVDERGELVDMADRSS